MPTTKKKSPWQDPVDLPRGATEAPKTTEKTPQGDPLICNQPTVRQVFDEICGQLGREFMAKLVNDMAAEMGPLSESFNEFITLMEPEEHRDFAIMRLAFFSGAKAFEKGMTSFVRINPEKLHDTGAFHAHMNRLYDELQMHWEAIKREASRARDEAKKA